MSVGQEIRICHHALQDSGTAIWLFAYFGYWLEIIIVMTSKGIRGSLMSAKKVNRKGNELPLGVKGTPPSRSGSESPITSRANKKAAGNPHSSLQSQRCFTLQLVTPPVACAACADLLRRAAGVEAA